MNLINKNDLFLLEELLKKNFSAKYKDSFLGILWSILKPLLIMSLLTVIFSTIFGKSIENYPVYFLSGKIIFDFFNLGTASAMNSLKNNINILKRNPAPKHIFVFGSVLSEFINFLITLILLVGVMIVTRAQFHLSFMLLSIIPIISLIIMVSGISLALAIICIYYTDIRHLWPVLTIMVMYGSALFYPMEIIPDPFHSVMILNPVFWIIDQFRHFFIGGTVPSAIYMINSLLVSMIILVVGVIIFKKYEKKVAMKF